MRCQRFHWLSVLGLTDCGNRMFEAARQFREAFHASPRRMYQEQRVHAGLVAFVIQGDNRRVRQHQVRAAAQVFRQ